ncbi:transposase [Streptomyces sp. ISL-94]|nr:transposase [Streptomyces sp. ISL-94]
MPTELGAWSTVHNRFRQWRHAGVFEALLEGLTAEAAKRGEVDLSLVGIDSTTARAHHDAAGMHLDEDVLTALEEAAAEAEKARSKGQLRRTKRAGGRKRSRAGRTKTHPASAETPAEGRPPGTLQGRADQQGPPRRRPQVPPPAFILTTGQAADSPQFIPVLEKVGVRGLVGRPRTRPDAVAGDKAYSSRGNRAHLHKRRIQAVVPEKKD